jgi:hypothetical protein
MVIKRPDRKESGTNRVPKPKSSEKPSETWVTKEAENGLE